MTAPTPCADPWSVLGLAPGAPPDEVARAWRALAARHHPDVGGDPAHFRRLAAAKQELLHLGLRADAPVTVVRAPGAVGSLLRPLRRRIDRRLRPRVR